MQLMEAVELNGLKSNMMLAHPLELDPPTAALMFGPPGSRAVAYETGLKFSCSERPRTFHQMDWSIGKMSSPSIIFLIDPALRRPGATLFSGLHLQCVGILLPVTQQENNTSYTCNLGILLCK